MQAEQAFELHEAVVELLSFVASFLAAGAVGFRYSSLRGRLTGGDAVPAEERDVFARAARRAAVLGLVGLAVTTLLWMQRLPGLAARRHLTVTELLTTDLPSGVRAAMYAIGLLGLALAAARRTVGWPLAAAGVILGALANVVLLQWTRLVNPGHQLVAGLWIGTLFVLVTAGISAVLRDEPARARRGAIVADMVHGFSPLALGSAALLVVSGITTAWRHLGSVPALWTSGYGRALILKLCFVALVFAFGAWNWRRQRPTLGTEEAAHAVRRSSTMELLTAFVVLILTTVVVSLPAPAQRRGPGGPGAPGGQPPAAPAPVAAPAAAPAPTPGT